MKTLTSLNFSRNVLIPGWIATVGLITVIAPPTSVPVSLAILVVGLFVVPASLWIDNGGEAKPSPAV
jgi:hypothetical protein